ncbi:hypothetical protein XELAEV_18013105mg [Xenopus laevis]|uniref:Uncharacterized protein n=1 Tax=Xenopus laevis TaxID=8355 RepID=A0A974HZB7_XENLA|nr:hypothetical protein XELAEV_18013105mg [Xenopus laevis]
MVHYFKFCSSSLCYQLDHLETCLFHSAVVIVNVTSLETTSASARIFPLSQFLFDALRKIFNLASDP